MRAWAAPPSPPLAPLAPLALLALCGAGGGAETPGGLYGYVLTNPADYDTALAAETIVDKNRSQKQCYCGGSRHINIWNQFHRDLHLGLAADPAFAGEWVHSACAVSYPLIFRAIKVDPEDDSFVMHTDCPAGVLAMVVVCAQSAALQYHESLQGQPSSAPSAPEAGAAGAPTNARTPAGSATNRESRSWRNTARVVLEEGPPLGDIFGVVPLKACLRECEQVPACLSVAHGPNGCHLKARCIREDDPMVPEGVQGDDYQTYFFEPCPAPAPLADGERTADAAPTTGNTALQNVQMMMGYALRALEFCFHCLDASPWPFLFTEVLENYALAVEAPADFRWQRSAGRLVGTSTQPGPSFGHGRRLGGTEEALDDQQDPPVPSMNPTETDASAAFAGVSPARLVLLRLQVRWTRGLEMEAEFWRKKLSPDPAVNDRTERLRTWLATGEVTWSLEGDDLCAYVASARAVTAAPPSQHLPHKRPPPPPRILNVGSGPLAPRPLECAPREDDRAAVGDGLKDRDVPVVAADGMTRFYLRILDDHGLSPPFLPLQCPVEELRACFPPGHFDVVHIRNALDHVFDPLLGIEAMLHVVRPGGWVLLRHARNEGVPGSFRNGLHQWAFDVAGCPKEADDTEVCQGPFLVWNPEMRVDVSAHLLGLGLAAEVRAELRDHPSEDAPADERYVWVDVRKPTREEAGRLLSQSAVVDA